MKEKQHLFQLILNCLLMQLKKLIVNAIYHRDYTSNASVQVMLFRNRLEIWNPGQLPYGLTVQKLQGPHKSLPTNPLIADPMYWKGYIEKVGTGTEDIIEKCLRLWVEDTGVLPGGRFQSSHLEDRRAKRSKAIQR